MTPNEDVPQGVYIPGQDPFTTMSQFNPQVQNELQKHAEGMFETWRDLAFEKPPDDIFGKIVWFAGMLGQLMLNLFMFPAALATFLMEEAVQSAGMGAYILSSSKNYDLLDQYLPNYKSMIDICRTATVNFTILAPISGGATLQYMEAADLSWMAFVQMTQRKLIEQAEKDEELRMKLLEEQKYGQLYITSSPSSAEIWINGVNTDYITPQTFKSLEGGRYAIELRRMAPKTEEWQIYVFEILIEAGRKKEINIRIPQNIIGEGEEEAETDGSDTNTLPDFLKAEVEGDFALDGDTFQTITGERIRVLGIDSPELGRPWADVAGAYLDELIHGKNITLRIQTNKPIDEFGRTLAICKMYKGDVAELILSSGLARTYFWEDDVYDHTSYELAEQLAKDRKIGIWSLL